MQSLSSGTIAQKWLSLRLQKVLLESLINEIRRENKIEMLKLLCESAELILKE